MKVKSLETEKTTTLTLRSVLLIAIIIIVACFCLFYLDKDTHSISDLFRPGILIALVIYFLPTFCISLLLHGFFSKKHNESETLLMSLGYGIPLGFILIITFLFVITH